MQQSNKWKCFFPLSSLALSIHSKGQREWEEGGDGAGGSWSGVGGLASTVLDGGRKQLGGEI